MIISISLQKRLLLLNSHTKSVGVSVLLLFETQIDPLIPTELLFRPYSPHSILIGSLLIQSLVLV